MSLLNFRTTPLFKRPDGTEVFLKDLQTNASSAPEIPGQPLGNTAPYTLPPAATPTGPGGPAFDAQPSPTKPGGAEAPKLTAEDRFMEALTQRITGAPQYTLEDIFDFQKRRAELQQQLGKESAKTAFQYEMMGRIPDTIMAGLAGSGQLMREGAKDISNTVMRGVEALPKPNIAARTYQQPTFRYFK